MEVDDSSITPSVVSTLSSAAAAAAGNDCTVNSSSDNSITITKATTTTSSAIDSTATKSSNSTIEPQPMDDDGGGSTTTATTTTTTTTSSSSSSGISIAQSSSETAMSSSVGNNKEDKTDMIITSTVDLPSTTTTTITTATKLTPSQSNEKETLTATTSFNDNDELLMNVTEKELDGSSSVVDDSVSTSLSKDNGIHSTEKLEIMNTEVAEDELNDMAKDILEGCTSGTGLEKADVKEKLPDNVVKAKTATKTMPPIIKVDSSIEQTNLPSKSSTTAINNDQKHQSKETAFMDDIDGDDDLIMKLEEIEGTSTISTTTKNSGTKEISNIDNKTTSTAATTTTTTTTTNNKNTIDSNVLKNLGGILEKNEETDYSKGNSRDTDDLLKDLECDDDNIISSLTKNNTTIVQTIDDQKKINKTVNNIDEQLINKNISVRQTDKAPKSNENISTITNEIKLNANQQVNNQSSSSSSSSMVVTKAAKNKDNNINKYNSIEHDDNDIVKELNATVPNTIKKVNQTNNSSSSNNTNNRGVEETVDSTQNSKSITLKRKRSVDDDEDLTISTNDVKIQKVGTTTPKAKCELMDVTVVDDDEQKIALNKKQDESIISSSTSSTPGDPKKSPETNLPIKIDLKHTKMVEIKFKSGKDSSETTKHETIKVQSSKISPNKTTQQQQQPTNNSKSPIDNQKTNTNKNKTNPLIKINVAAASTTISKPIQPVKQSDQQQQQPQLSKEIGNRTQVIPPKKVKIDVDKKKSDGSGIVDTSKTVNAQQKSSDSTNITITKTITTSNDSNKVKDSVKASSSDNNSVNSEILRIPEVESINSKPRIKNTGSSSTSSSTTTTTSISQQKKQQSKDISSNKISCENNCITKDTATNNESKQQLPLSKYPIESHNGLSLSNATTEAEDAEDIEMEDKTTSTNDNAKKEKKQTTPIKSSSGSPSLDKENTNVNKTNISNPTISNANNLIYEINIDNDHEDDDNDHHYLNIMTIKRIMDEEKSQAQELNTTDSVTKTDAQKTNLMESKQIKETFKGIPAVCNWIIDYFTKLKHSCGADGGGGGGGGNVDKVDDAKSTPKSNKNISTPKTTATKKQATTKTVKQQSGKKPGNKRKLNKNDEDNHENDNTTTTTATTTTTTTNITTAAGDEPKPKKSHQQKLSIMNSSVESLNNSMDNINNGKQQQLLQSAMTIPSDAKCCLAKWVDKKFYAAKVIGENGFKKYSIRFEDGIKKVLPDESVIIGMDDTGILPLLNEEIHALIDKETYEPGIVLECTKSVDDPNQIIYKVACATVTVSVTSAEIYLEDAQAKLIKKNIQKKQLAEESTTTINSMGETTTNNNTTTTNTTTATSTPDKIQQLSPQIEPRRSAGRPAKYNPQLFVKTVDRGSSSPKITTPTSTVKRGRKSNKDKLAAAVAAATAAAEAEEQQKLITTKDVSSSPLVTGDSTTTISTDVNSIGDAAPAVVISDNTPEKNRRGKSENITNKTTAAATSTTTSTTTPSPSSTTTVTTNI